MVSIGQVRPLKAFFSHRSVMWGQADNVGTSECRRVPFIYFLVVNMLLIEVNLILNLSWHVTAFVRLFVRSFVRSFVCSILLVTGDNVLLPHFLRRVLYRWLHSLWKSVTTTAHLQWQSRSTRGRESTHRLVVRNEKRAAHSCNPGSSSRLRCRCRSSRRLRRRSVRTSVDSCARSPPCDHCPPESHTPSTTHQPACRHPTTYSEVTATNTNRSTNSPSKSKPYFTTIN